MATCPHCGAEHVPAPQTCPVVGEPLSSPGLIGARLDRYQIVRLLGAGGFGAVYRARHVHTDAEVALKVLKRQLSQDPQMLERLLREAKAAAAVGSRHIVQVLDAGIADGQAFIAMELLDGVDLRELASREPLTPVRLVLLGAQVLDGLSDAHAKGVIHRDMKPANVFVARIVDDAGVEKDFVKLLDFGISKFLAQQDGPLNALTATGVAMGTPAYMAPEQFFSAKNVDARADLYSVGVMLYELLAGRLPFKADSYADLVVQLRTQVPPPLASVAPQVPPALAAVVDRALVREAAGRWQSAAEMGDALRASMGMRPRPSRPSALAGATPSAPSAAPGWVVTPAGAQALSDQSMLGATAPPRQTPYGNPAATPSGMALDVTARTPARQVAPVPQPTPAQQVAVQGGQGAWIAPQPSGVPPPPPPYAGPVVQATPAPQYAAQGWAPPPPPGAAPPYAGPYAQPTPAPWTPQPAAPVVQATPQPWAVPQAQTYPPQRAKSSGPSAAKIVLIVVGVLFSMCFFSSVLRGCLGGCSAPSGYYGAPSGY